MRLVCPNCEAKYEVPEDAIPDVGRDVQCASCGHGWFQMRPRAATAVAEPPLPLSLDPVLAEEPAPASTTDVEAVAEAVPEAIADETPAAEPDSLAPAEPEPVPAPVEIAAIEDQIAEVEDIAAEAEPAAPEAVEPDPMPQPDVVSEAQPETDLVPEVDTAVAAELDAPEAEAALSDQDMHAAAEAADETAADLVVQPDPEPAVEAEAEAEQDADADDATSPVAVAAAAYAVDEGVLAILREEAEREAQARRAEARPLESQPDLGLDAAMRGRAKPSLVTDNGAAMGGDGDAVLKTSARRDLLPDVEEINSTLRPSEVANHEFIQDGTSPRDARGFRSGFLMVMAVAIIGAAVYTAAPRLASMVPALAGPLDAYVRAVDSLRLSLDGIMQSATVAINGE